MPSTLDDLLRLPAGQRADLAMALWASLSDEERDEAIGLSPDQRTELERRWHTYLEHPSATIAWTDLKKALTQES